MKTLTLIVLTAVISTANLKSCREHGEIILPATANETAQPEINSSGGPHDPPDVPKDRDNWRDGR